MSNAVRDQESVLDYEGGFKATLLDHSVQINGAGFHYDYTNKQTRSELIDPVFGVLNALVNVPKSELTGGETEITYSPIHDLHLNFAGTYVASKIDQFVGVGFNGGIFNFAGSPLPFIPKWSLNGGAITTSRSRPISRASPALTRRIPGTATRWSGPTRIPS